MERWAVSPSPKAVMNMIASRTPLRVSFFGGGTDFRDFYEKEYGCVLSTAIDKHIYIIINRKFDGRIQLNYRVTETVDAVQQITHPTIREAMKLTGIDGGIELSAQADVPSHGTGLGSSSSFVVGVLNALHSYKQEQVTAETLAQEACRIEIEMLNEPIGKQDQYITTYGGFNFIRFNQNGTVTVTPVSASAETINELHGRLLFFYTGIGRRSKDVLSEQKRNIDGKMETLGKMKAMAEQAFNELNHNRFDIFGELLNEAWLLKKSLANHISNEIIDRHYDKAINAGAAGGKVLGAGGGGFLMFYCNKEHQDNVRKALCDLREVRFNFPVSGTRIVYNDSNKEV